MEADHRQPAFRCERAERGIQARLEVGQLAVDVDADGLERTRRRMDPAPVGCARAARHHRRDQFRQLGGALDRPLRATRDDGAGDAPRLALLAVGVEHVGDLRLRCARQPLRRALAGVGIHAHVQRAVLAERETAFGDVELRRGHTEVEQHAIESGHAPVREVGEAAAADRHARIAPELAFGHGDRLGILVHQQQPASGAQSREHAARMAAAPERAV